MPDRSVPGIRIEVKGWMIITMENVTIIEHLLVQHENSIALRDKRTR